MATTLYDTFGNEVKYRFSKGTLEAYLENATIKFPLPEASSEILGELASTDGINHTQYEIVKTRLEQLGFQEPNAKAMAAILVRVAQDQGVDPMAYFEVNNTSLKLASDTYDAINLIRPSGNRIGLRIQERNSASRYSKIIKP